MAYVVADAAAGLVAAAAAGAAAGLVVLVERLHAGARPTPAAVGFLSVLALVLLALATGRPEAFFLPAVVSLAAQSAGLLAAACAGRPVTGHVARWLDAVPADWRSRGALRRLFVAQDLLWSQVFALRSAVTAAFALSGSVSGAGLFRLTGTPMYLLLVLLCVRWAGPRVRAVSG